MGVTGLWRLIEPAGKPVPVETLENKVLAVDISIWLHQIVKGYQDAKGAPLPNAHLMGLFQRLCKLLYFRIKPIFVFDGGFPDLKKETIAKRQDHKSKYNSESERLKRELALLLGKKTAISSLLGKQISPKKSSNVTEADKDDIFKLPALPQHEEETESESDDEQNSSASTIDLHTVDIESDKFKNMPAKEKYDLLVELKETRKMNSWGKLHTLPKKSDNFSDFQMQRLLKRRKIQECLEETEKEIGDGSMSLNELESMLNEEGIDTKIESLPTRRIAANNTTRFLLINNVKQALADAKKKKEAENQLDHNVSQPETINMESNTDANTEEDDLQKAIKMSLECTNEHEVSACTSKTDDSWTSMMSDSDYSYTESDDGYVQPDMSSAKAYIMQYSDFTHEAIEELVSIKNNKSKSLGVSVDNIINELNNEKSIVVDKIDFSSDDEEKCKTNAVLNLKVQKCKKEDNNNLNVNNVNTIESSVICINNPIINDITTLDTSTDDEPPQVSNKFPSMGHIESTLQKQDENSTDSEFEEVLSNSECTSKKAVVELTLNMSDNLDENDIFADVFIKNPPIKNESKLNTHSLQIDVQRNVVRDEQVKKTDIASKGCDSKNLIREESEKEIKLTNDPSSIEDSIKTDSKHFPNTKEPIVTKLTEIKEINNKVNPLNDAKIVIEQNEPSKQMISSDELQTMVDDMQNKEENLLQEKGRLDRIGRNITEQMTKEAQELLQIFGIPYIVAPMEAEAQCAFLESIKLTDGTITDDSDIWLFGGKTVYKNFFNQKKHVLQFLADRIEKSFNLTREQFILLALLVGSDYTTGVNGVGPVTALEILASFPFNKRQLNTEVSKQDWYTQIVAGLQDFKKWVRAGKKTDNTSLKKKLKNVDVTDDFPSIRVVQAYLEPNIEKSEEKFTWGNLDITILRDYAKSKFGWSQNKLDEIIKPVLNRLANRKTQRTVHDYFQRKIEFQSLENQMSKRVKAAVQKMDPNKNDVVDTSEENKPKAKKKRKVKQEEKDPSDSQNLDMPSASKQMKKIDDNKLIIKAEEINEITNKGVEIKIPKSERFQEIIPQREKDKQNILQNKLKAIEIYRKAKIDRKSKRVKRKVNLPKEKAELSESSDDN